MTEFVLIYLALAFFTYAVICRYVLHDEPDLGHVFLGFFFWPVVWVLAAACVVIFCIFTPLDWFGRFCRKNRKH